MTMEQLVTHGNINQTKQVAFHLSLGTIDFTWYRFKVTDIQNI